MRAFLPKTEAAKREFLQFFKENLDPVAQQLNADAQDVRILDGKIAIAIENIDEVRQKELELAAAIQKRNDDWQELAPEMVKFVDWVRASKGFSKDMAEKLGIEEDKTIKAVKSTVRTEKLTVKVSPQGKKVVFDFNRPSRFAVVIYSRRANEIAFSQYKFVTGKTFEDTRPNLDSATAEKREYCFALFKDDKEGEMSSVYSVAVL